MFRKKIIGITNVARSSQVFTLFERLPVQKDTLFWRRSVVKLYTLKTLKTIPCSSGTYPCMPNKGVPPGIPPPPGPDLLYNTVEIRFFEPSGEKKMLRIIGRFRKTGIRYRCLKWLPRVFTNNPSYLATLQNESGLVRVIGRFEKPKVREIGILP